MRQGLGKTAVFMGGTSAEREVSLRSGEAVLAGLLRKGVDAVAIDPARDLVAQLEQQRPDRVFIILHGRGGEDGTMQGFLETLGIPYTGSGVQASAITMNKQFTKQIWQGSGLPTPAMRLLTADSDWDAVIQQLGLPLMVKPVHEGSSLGMTKVTEAGALQAAWESAARYDSLVMAESFIQGGEYTASILGETCLPLIRLEPAREFYDYQAKYSDDRTRYICPCGLPAAREQSLQALALEAFQTIGARGWGRVDFMLDQAGQPWLLEVNTAPGMTDHSLVPMAARVAGMDFDTLVVKILEAAAGLRGL